SETKAALSLSSKFQILRSTSRLVRSGSVAALRAFWVVTITMLAAPASAAIANVFFFFIMLYSSRIVDDESQLLGESTAGLRSLHADQVVAHFRCLLRS